MKFLTGLVLIMTMTAVTAQAQHVNLGFKGGLNLYNIHNDNGGMTQKLVLTWA